MDTILWICGDLYKNLNRKNDVLPMLLDFTKAFDKVWHTVPVRKLQNIGIGGILLKLLKSYSSEWRQMVVINGCRSDCGYINAGVL